MHGRICLFLLLLLLAAASASPLANMPGRRLLTEPEPATEAPTRDTTATTTTPADTVVDPAPAEVLAPGPGPVQAAAVAPDAAADGGCNKQPGFPVDHGHWPFCANSRQGDTCTAVCDLNGAGLITACDHGDWVPPIGSGCNPGQDSSHCGSAPVFNSQHIDWSSCVNVPVGRTCNGRCINGFVGGAQAVCGTGGKWQNMQDWCTQAPSGCPRAPDETFPHSFFPADCAGRADNEWCHATCKEGYKPGGGVAKATQCVNGDWTPAVGVDCVPDREIKGGCIERPDATLSYGSWPAACDNLRAGQSCDEQCFPGWRGGKRAECQDNGTWKIKGMDCTQGTVCYGQPDMFFVLPGQTGWDDSCWNALAGQSCDMVCAPGYTAVGRGQTYCTSSGIWDHTTNIPEEVPAHCARADTPCQGKPYFYPLFDRISWPCDGGAPGTLCFGSCPAGFDPEQAQARCLGGVWVQEKDCVPKEIVKCQSLPPSSWVLGSGQWDARCYGAAQGTTCKVVCSSGFTGGYVRAECGSDGYWLRVANPPGTETSAACVFIGNTFIGNTPCTSNPQVSLLSVPGVFWPSACDNKPAGAACTGSCTGGFKLDDTNPQRPVVKCADGRWVMTSGLCVSDDRNPKSWCETNPPLPVSFGSWPDCTNSQNNDKCKASCLHGGDMTAVCLSGMWFHVAQTACNPPTPGDKDCKAKPEWTVANGYWPASCANAKEGNTCKAVCNNGGSTTASCYGGKWIPWTGEPGCATGPVTKHCSGLPPDTISAAIGYWPEDCRGLDVGRVCTASCRWGGGTRPYFALCGPDGWERADGDPCKTSATNLVCSGAAATSNPPNAYWPSKCRGKHPGEYCRAVCYAGYTPVGGVPRKRCNGDNVNPRWGPLEGSCV